MRCAATQPETNSRRLPGLRTVARLAALWLIGPFVALAGGETGAAAQAALVGKPLPALSGFKFEGEVPALAGKVVMIDIWASWCGPCKASFPELGELQKRYAERGLVIVGVSVDENAKAYAKFLEKQKPPFATVRDLGLKFADALEPAMMPTSYLIDRRGVIRFVHEGYAGKASVDAYTREIEQLLSESAP